MKTYYLIFVVLTSTPVNSVLAENTVIDTLLQLYASQGAAAADAEQGQFLWQKSYQANGEFVERRCASCHTEKLTAPGKHIKTSKLIEPMAPSVNPQRLTDQKKIEKWFKRNCKWTMGRECTAQEKADLLLYINK
jgi:hypothetical protein